MDFDLRSTTEVIREYKINWENKTCLGLDCSNTVKFLNPWIKIYNHFHVWGYKLKHICEFLLIIIKNRFNIWKNSSPVKVCWLKFQDAPVQNHYVSSSFAVNLSPGFFDRCVDKMSRFVQFLTYVSQFLKCLTTFLTTIGIFLSWPVHPDL